MKYFHTYRLHYSVHRRVSWWIQLWTQLWYDCSSTALRPFDDRRYDRRPSLAVVADCSLNKLCAWRHNMPPSPASLTIISCKYENLKDYNLPLNSLKDKQQQHEKISLHCYFAKLSSWRHCQSKAKHSRIWAQGCAFLPIKQLDLWSDLDSGVHVRRDVGYLCANFSLPRPLCSRLRPDVRDRQTDVRQNSDSIITLCPAY